MLSESSVLAAEMDEERRKRPDLLEVKSLPGFGPFLSIRWPEGSGPSDRYPGWRQSRVLGDAPFDLIGPGPEPSAAVLAAWATLGDRLTDVLAICTSAVKELADRTTDRDLGADRRGYLAALGAALASGHLVIQGFNFDDGGGFRVVLGSPEIEDFSPFVDFDGLRVVDCQFSE